MFAAPALAQTPPSPLCTVIGGSNMGSFNHFVKDHSSFNNYQQIRKAATEVDLPPPNEINQQLKTCRSNGPD